MIMTSWISPDGSVVVLLCFEKRLHELQFGQQRWNIISLRHPRDFVTLHDNKNITFYTEYSFQLFFNYLITTKTHTHNICIINIMVIWFMTQPNENRRHNRNDDIQTRKYASAIGISATTQTTDRTPDARLWSRHTSSSQPLGPR